MFFGFFDIFHLLCFGAMDRQKMTCQLTYWNIGISGGPGAGAMDISQNDDDLFDAVVELDSAIMGESMEIECSQRERGLINHATGNVSNINTARMEEIEEMTRLQRSRVSVIHAMGTLAEINALIMEESESMTRSQQARVLIDHVTGTAVNIDTEGIK